MRSLSLIAVGLYLAGTAFAVNYPVKLSSSNPRILVDQNNIPFLMVGDSPQSLIVNLSQPRTQRFMWPTVRPTGLTRC